MPTQSAEELIEQHQDLVRSLALSIHRKLPPYVELEDLAAYGQVGLAEAARDFDATRGSRFSTYAYYRIRGAIYDGLSKMTWFSRARHNRVRAERMANDVLEGDGAANLPAGESRTEADMRWMKNVTRALTVVYLASSATSENDDRSTRLLEDHAAPTAANAAIQREVIDKLHQLIDMLPREPGDLIRATYFEGLTLAEAGRRLGVSKSWASRLHAKALQELARDLRLQGVAP